MPQGHRHQKSAGSDQLFHAHLRVATGGGLFFLLFQQSQMLNTLQRGQLRQREGHTVIFKLFCFQKHALSLTSASGTIRDVNFSNCSKLTIAGDNRDLRFTCRNTFHRDRVPFHGNGREILIR